MPKLSVLARRHAGRPAVLTDSICFPAAVPNTKDSGPKVPPAGTVSEQIESFGDTGSAENGSRYLPISNGTLAIIVSHMSMITPARSVMSAKFHVNSSML
jgi:hypothetical protein